MEDENNKTASLVNFLFIELEAIFPAFRQAWSTEEVYLAAKRNWTDELIRQKINDLNLIKSALIQCRHVGRFAPSIGEFIALCKPKTKTAAHQDFKQIEYEKPPSTKEVALSHLSKIKSMLG